MALILLFIPGGIVTSTPNKKFIITGVIFIGIGIMFFVLGEKSLKSFKSLKSKFTNIKEKKNKV
jgi:hypothetical protein